MIDENGKRIDATASAAANIHPAHPKTKHHQKTEQSSNPII
jgi:hypothetical protein